MGNSIVDVDFPTSMIQKVRSTPLSSFSSFGELCCICNLRSLEADSVSILNNCNPFQLPNPHFYPILSCPATLDLFQEHIERDLSALYTSVRQQGKQKKSNLSNKEFRALKTLSQNKDLVVKSANKARL